VAMVSLAPTLCSAPIFGAIHRCQHLMFFFNSIFLYMNISNFDNR